MAFMHMWVDGFLCFVSMCVCRKCDIYDARPDKESLPAAGAPLLRGEGTGIRTDQNEWPGQEHLWRKKREVFVSYEASLEKLSLSSASFLFVYFPQTFVVVAFVVVWTLV